MGRDRLAELQKQSKHAPVTEEEEMAPLNKKAKKMAKKDANAETLEVIMQRSNGLKLCLLSVVRPTPR